MPTPICLHTPRLLLQPPQAADAAALLDYQLRNRTHLQAWEPRRDAAYFTIEGVTARIAAASAQMAADSALHLLLRRVDDGALIGECAFTNIVRGPFQACYLGFSLCQQAEGQGWMAEALRAALAHVFNELALHRVMANYRPENRRSAALLKRLGFEEEGRARDYLYIDGAWRDHILTALIKDAAP